MKREKDTLAAGVVKLVLCGLILIAATTKGLAATDNWKGTTSNDWFTSSNWDNGVPTPSSDVYIGINVAYTTQPVLNSASVTTSTINSLNFGPYISGLGVFNNVNGTITLSANNFLIVNNAVTVQPSIHLFGAYNATIAGSGSLTCASVTVGNLTSFPSGVVLLNNLLELISTVSNLHVTGGVTVDGTSFGILIGLLYNNSKFSLQGGTMVVDGTLLTAYATGGLLPTPPTVNFSVDIPSGSALSPVLQLTNASALNTGSVAGSIDFYNNTGGTGTSTVYYNGAAQEVYTNSTACLDNTPQTYQYLYLTGAGTKTTDAGTLTVGASLNSSATSVLLNTNNTAATVKGSWTNSSNVTQGSGNITISGTVTNNSGGTLNLGTGNFYIGVNYTNNVGGVYSQSTGTTIFNGAGAQALVDNSTTGTTFKLVNFSGGGASTMSAGTNNVNFFVASTGILTMSNSSSLAAGSTSAAYLTLKSDTLGTATVAAIPTGCSITGFVTVQRFVQGSSTFDVLTNKWKARNYRMMSSQVNEGVDGSGNYPCSINYIGASTIVSDCTSTYGTMGGNPSLYLFNENYTPSNATFISGNFFGLTNISSTTAPGTISTTNTTYPQVKLYVGESILMYFRGDKITHLTGTPNKTTAPFVAPESVTFSTTGNLNQGTYSVVSWTGTAGLMYTTSNVSNAAVRGYNMVGNPYASSIDWSTFSNTNSAAPIYGYKINPTVYEFNPTTSNYDTYNSVTGIATGSASKIIPSGEGFFVQANSTSPALTFNESAKSNTILTGSSLLMGTPAAQTAYNSFMRLKLITDSNNYNDMVIGFNSTSTKTFNATEDAVFFPSSGEAQSICAISADSINIAAKWLPFPTGNTNLVVPLKVNARASGQYTIQRTDFASIPAIYEVWLMDRYQKDSLDIKNNTTYIFSINLADTNSFGSNRFQVVVRQNPALAVHLLNFSAVKATGGAQLAWTTENEANYTNFTVERSSNGGATFDVLDGVSSNSQGTYSFLDKNPPVASDIYRVMIQNLNGVISYTNTVTLVYGGTIAAAASAIVIYPNPSSGLINLAINQTNIGQSVSGPQSGVSPLQAYSTSPTLAAGTVKAPSSYDIRIVNVTGEVVKAATSSSANWQANLNSLTPGTYVIQVVNNKDKSLVGKGTFIKM